MKTVGLIFVSTLLLAPAVLAQSKVKIGPGGVEVEAPDVKIKADESGAEVQAEGVEVKAGHQGASIRIGGGSKAKSSHAPAAEPVGSGRAPIVCRGNDEKVYTGLTIRGHKYGVLVQGNCELTLKNCTIDAREYGILLQGNGDVKLERCRIKGRKAAIVIQGNGDVTASGCTIEGGIETTGNGEFEDEGNNIMK